MLAIALLPGGLTLSGCQSVLGDLSPVEKGIVAYCIVAVLVLLWLLHRVRAKGQKRGAQQPPPQWQVEAGPAPAQMQTPAPAPVRPPAPQPQQTSRPVYQQPQPAPRPAYQQPQPAAPVARPAAPAPVREQAPAFGNPWWDIPAGTYIFIDTCVLMEATHDHVVSAWFDHLKKNFRRQDWTIVILNSVIRELDGLKNSPDEERSQASRAATNLLSDMQRTLGPRFVITGANRTPADDEFEREMQEGDLLCTRDNNLALRINGIRGLRALGLADFPRIPRTMRRA